MPRLASLYSHQPNTKHPSVPLSPLFICPASPPRFYDFCIINHFIILLIIIYFFTSLSLSPR